MVVQGNAFASSETLDLAAVYHFCAKHNKIFVSPQPQDGKMGCLMMDFDGLTLNWFSSEKIEADIRHAPSKTPL